MKQIFTLIICCVFLTSYAQKPQDCSTAFPICEMGSFHFSQLSGFGDQLETFSKLSCTSEPFAETNSSWLKFEIDQPGILTFIIQPEKSKDDLDFFLFSSTGNCNDFIEVRCMASGDSFDEFASNCMGKTGLDIKSLDEFESSGCKYNDDNFLKYLQVESGEKYYLLVNNFDSDGGYSITIEGTAELRSLDRCATKTHSLEITEVFPNPSRELLNISYNAPAKQKMKLSILDMEGSVISTNIYNSEKGLNDIRMLVSDIQSGSYIINLEQGGSYSSKFFVKQ